jgi:hypothetical protein
MAAKRTWTDPAAQGKPPTAPSRQACLAADRAGCDPQPAVALLHLARGDVAAATSLQSIVATPVASLVSGLVRANPFRGVG